MVDSGAQLISKPDNLKTVEPTFGPDGRYIWFFATHRCLELQRNCRNTSWLFMIARLAKLKDVPTSMALPSRQHCRPTVNGWSTVRASTTRLVSFSATSRMATNVGLHIPCSAMNRNPSLHSVCCRQCRLHPIAKNSLASYGGKIYRIPAAGGPAVNIPFEISTELLLGPRVDFKYPIKDDKDITGNTDPRHRCIATGETS